MNEFLGVVVSMHGTHAVCRDLVTGYHWAADVGPCDAGEFVYADGTPRVVTGETLPRPDLWEAAAARAAACVDGGRTLVPRLMAEREKAIRGQRRATPVKVNTPEEHAAWLASGTASPVALAPAWRSSR